MPISNPYYNDPVTDHFDGARFLNPGEPETDRSFRDIVRWKRTAPDIPWRKSVPVDPVVPDARVIMLDLDARVAVGMHWGTFKLTDEGREDPALRLSAGLKARGLEQDNFIAKRPADVAQFG